MSCGKMKTEQSAMDVSCDETVICVSNDETPVTRVCFVCGILLTEGEQKIVEAETSYFHIPVANKIGEVIGNGFCIVISKLDEICRHCFLSIDEIDQMEYNLKCAREKILTLLQNKYNFILQDEVVKSVTETDVKKDVAEPRTPDESFLTNVRNESKLDSGSSLCAALPSSKYKINGDGEVISKDFSTVKNVSFPESSLDSKKYDNNEEDNINSGILSTEVRIKSMESGEICEPKESLSKDILCEYCCSCFYTVEELNEHIKHDHESQENDATDDMYDCAPNEVFIDDTSKEEKSTVSNVVFKCGVCDFSHSDRVAVLKHLQKNHRVSCEICGAGFDRVSTLLVHYMSHNKNDGVCVCAICEMPFPSKTILARHEQVHKKSGGPVMCQVCGIICQDNLHAMYHRRNEHSVVQDLACGLCNVPMESNAELKHHILSVHRGKKEFKCKECDMTFSRQLQYDNHVSYAHGNSQCRVCGKRIENVVKLRQHEHRHARSETKKYECDICHKVFKTHGGLKVHSVSHTGKYKFFCEFCGRGFMSKVILEEHKGVHTKEERYVCDTCGRKFVLYSTFHLHKQWHKDPYPFPCKICGRKFRYRSERSNHVRRDHTGETPYKCQHCDAAFFKLGYLKKHLVVHTKVHPHTCNICDKGYDQKKALAYHYAKVHNDSTLLQSFPKTCQYKVALRPEEYPEVEDE